MIEGASLTTVRIPGRSARFHSMPEGIPAALIEQLGKLGIEQLYSHQAEAFGHARAGEDVLVVTGTSSGKTLCFNLPVLSALHQEPSAHAMFLYPTKALAQDQLGKLQALADPLGVRISTYDGETPKSRRAMIRQNSHIILTNPDMLHVGILPGHEQWAKFFKSLRYIVLDELHVYRGVFGSHCAWVLSRLLRLAKWYGSRPQIIGASATIAQPQKHFFELTGREPYLVAQDSAQHYDKELAFLIDSDEHVDESLLGGNNTDEIAARAVVAFLNDGDRVLCFCRSRQTTERLLRRVRQQLPPEMQASVDSYRGGYTPKERRALEKALFKGDLKALITTNAMEMGVDVGDLDTVILNGFPPTPSSFIQQVGRVGRAKFGRGIAIARNDPMEHLLASHPSLLLDNALEPCRISPRNEVITRSHLLCAAYERPIASEEFVDQNAALQRLVESGELRFQAGRYFYPSHEAPAHAVSLRGGSRRSMSLMVDGEVLGTMEYERALREAFPGAIYLHRGEPFVVTKTQWDNDVAFLQPENTQAQTQSVVTATVEVTAEIETAPPVHLHAIRVTEVTHGYRKFGPGQPASYHELEIPSRTVQTLGIALSLDFDPEDEQLIGAVHGTEHALAAVVPIIAGCDRGDIGSAWYAFHPDLSGAAVFIYDLCEGGVGITQTLFEHRHRWIDLAHELLTTCPCDEGCPRCLLSSRCEIQNQSLNKQAAISVLDRWRTVPSSPR